MITARFLPTKFGRSLGWNPGVFCSNWDCSLVVGQTNRSWSPVERLARSLPPHRDDGRGEQEAQHGVEHPSLPLGPQQPGGISGWGQAKEAVVLAAELRRTVVADVKADGPGSLPGQQH